VRVKVEERDAGMLSAGMLGYIRRVSASPSAKHWASCCPQGGHVLNGWRQRKEQWSMSSGPEGPGDWEEFCRPIGAAPVRSPLLCSFQQAGEMEVPDGVLINTGHHPVGKDAFMRLLGKPLTRDSKLSGGHPGPFSVPPMRTHNVFTVFTDLDKGRGRMLHHYRTD